MAVFNATGYSALGYSPSYFNETLAELNIRLRELLAKHDAQAIVVRGTSGVIIAGAMTVAAPDLPFVIARKIAEKSHAGVFTTTLGRELDVGRYIILDDFVSSGKTVRGIIEDIKDRAGPAQCVAMLSYRFAADCAFKEDRYKSFEGFPTYSYS